MEFLFCATLSLLCETICNNPISYTTAYHKEVTEPQQDLSDSHFATYVFFQTFINPSAAKKILCLLLHLFYKNENLR